MTTERAIIVLAEDTPAHAELIVGILQKQQLGSIVYHIQDSERALNYLFRKGDYINPGGNTR